MEQSNTPTTANAAQDAVPKASSRKAAYVPPRVTVYGNVTALTGGGGGALFDGGGTNNGLI